MCCVLCVCVAVVVIIVPRVMSCCITDTPVNYSWCITVGASLLLIVLGLLLRSVVLLCCIGLMMTLLQFAASFMQLGCTALLASCSNGNLGMTQLLVQHGALADCSSHVSPTSLFAKGLQ